MRVLPRVSMLATVRTTIVLCFMLSLLNCGSAQKTKPDVSLAQKQKAVRTLNETIKPLANAKTSTSTDIDWPAGVLPWDRFTLPVFSPNGLHAVMQLGNQPATSILCGDANTPIDSTNIELHALDPVRGRRIAPLHISRKGLLLGRFASNNHFLVTAPLGEQGRWIGQIDWATGSLTWIASDTSMNCFPAISASGDYVWSRKVDNDDRFHLVYKSLRGTRVIDDGKSDWLLPFFVGTDRLRAYRIYENQLALVELDIRARDPLLTAISLPIVETGATRKLAWQIATTNPAIASSEHHAFYHPILKRMVVWQPDRAIPTVSLAPNSVAAAPVTDGTWLVATNSRVLRQSLGAEDGIHLRNQMAIPIATTSKQWTHMLLIPSGNRLEIRAMNLSK
jgi:hypothetical protein